MSDNIHDYNNISELQSPFERIRMARSGGIRVSWRE